MKIRIKGRTPDPFLALESEIGHLVYQLYGLTEEEIKIVEGKEKKVAPKFGGIENDSYICTIESRD